MVFLLLLCLPAHAVVAQEFSPAPVEAVEVDLAPVPDGDLDDPAMRRMSPIPAQPDPTLMDSRPMVPSERTVVM